MAVCPVCDHSHDDREVAMNGDVYRCPGGHIWVVQERPPGEIETNPDLRERVSELVDGR